MAALQLAASTLEMLPQLLCATVAALIVAVRSLRHARDPPHSATEACALHLPLLHLRPLLPPPGPAVLEGPTTHPPAPLPPQIVVEGFAIPQRIRLRHIPGSPPTWLLGHMLRVKRRHRLFLYEMWQEMGVQHGKIFKWFWGTQPVITIRGGSLGRGGPRLCARRQRQWRRQQSAAAACARMAGPSSRRSTLHAPLTRPAWRLHPPPPPVQTQRWRASCA
jgi:hypothetical protein